ncbi:MAG: D-glycero-alpha-D-manno-heptose-1,7-bisphosphate 7-phosphatase [Bacteroidota bacterium]|jgi:D-glycero-D-manno-heptose 1,7-bisphosphate phosphatase
MKKALFLDRDGVINHDPGDYTYALEEFILLPNALNAMKYAQDLGYEIVIVTNQAGVSKGLYSKQEVDRIHAFLRSECAKKEIEIRDIYYSVHHPDICNSISRKPHGLWVERACAKYGYDKNHSFMIGDRERDVQCAETAGVKGFQMEKNGDLLQYVKNLCK